MPIHDARHVDGADYIASSFIEGQTLRKSIADSGKPTQGETGSIIEKLAAALHYAQTKGIIRRDVKTNN